MASPADITVEWDRFKPREWEKLLEKADRVPLEQSWAYGEALAGSSPYGARHAVFYRGKKPIAVAQIQYWPFPMGFQIAKAVRGPVFLGDVDVDQMAAVLRLLRDEYPSSKLNFFTQMPELQDEEPAHAAAKKAGIKRVVTGYSTAWLDLRPDLEALRAGLHPKWRNQLRKAEKAKLKIRDGHGGAPLEWVLMRHDANRIRKKFRAPTGVFVKALAICLRDKNNVRVFSAYEGSKQIAAILLLRHGNSATYYIAATGEEGRAAYAHNLLLWHGIETLKAAGVKWIDLGGLDGGRMLGIARFKLGTGAELSTLAGSFL